MSALSRFTIKPPLLNSACPWASDLEDLTTLYSNPFTGAVTTRTATLKGFPDDPTRHQVAFHNESISSVNSYGYSPYPLSQYIEWVGKILRDNLDSNKPIIVSITAPLALSKGQSIQSLDIPVQDGETVQTGVSDEADPGGQDELSHMISAIQELRRSLGDMDSASPRLAIEINTSCPNIEGHPPPAYEPSSLRPILQAVSDAFFQDETLAVGLKLPPYVHSQQFSVMVDFLASFSRTTGGTPKNPISFLTCTNTLGSSILFDSQCVDSQSGDGPEDSLFALPSIWGGLAGEAIHPLALGNVHAFSKLLGSHKDEVMRSVMVVGVGGVVSPAAAERMVRAGASLVGCATALGRRGVGVFEELAKASVFSE